MQIKGVDDITLRYGKKYTVAQCILNKADEPELVLKSIFQNFINQFEKESNTQLELTIQNRVWSSFSRNRAASLKKTFTLAFCDNILINFTDDEIDQMLKKFTGKGPEVDKYCRARLELEYILKKNKLLQSLIQEANSMSKEFISEIIEAVKNEGV